MRVGQAPRIIISRLIDVLEAKLSDEILQASIPNLKLVYPEKKDYYNAGQYLENMLATSPVAVIVEQSNTDTLRDLASGDSTFHKGILTLPVAIRIIFSVDAYDTVDYEILDREYTQPEYLQLASEVYKDALINVIYKYSQEKCKVHHVQYVSGTTAVDQSSSGLMAVAFTEWIIETEVDIPMPQIYTDRFAGVE